MANNLTIFFIETVNKWKTFQVGLRHDTQADIKKLVYMEVPPGVNFPGLARDTHCLKIVKNLYGGKESGRTWFKHLQQVLTTKLGHTQSTFEEYVYYKFESVFFLYTDEAQ